MMEVVIRAIGTKQICNKKIFKINEYKNCLITEQWDHIKNTKKGLKANYIMCLLENLQEYTKH